MTTETVMPLQTTSENAEHVVFFIRWWQEILATIITILVGWYIKAKGNTNVIVPISEDEIDHKITIGNQSVMLALQKDLDARDAKLREFIESQNSKLIDHVKDIIK